MDTQSEFERSYESTNEEFTVTKVNNSVVIGETHVRINPSQREDERFNILLEENRDSLFVLEGNPQQSNVWSNTETSSSFMTKALQFAEENNIRVEIMNDERIYKYLYEIWQEAGSDFSQHDFDSINSIYIMRHYLNILTFEQIVNKINNSEVLDEDRKQTYLNGFSKYIRLLQSEDSEKKLESVDKLIPYFILYDSTCREIYYQKKIAEIRKEDPDKKIFAVFGKSHTEGISKTLQDSNYRTPLPPIAKMKWLMGSI